mgnify:CR=1 FL=1
MSISIFRVCLLPAVVVLVLFACAPRHEEAAVSAPPQPKHRTESCTINGLNIRAEPSVKAAVLGSLAKGESVEILEQVGHWILVRTSEQLEGYVYGAYLTGFDIAPSRARGQSGKAAGGKPEPQEPGMMDSDDTREPGPSPGGEPPGR